jgi:ABC-type bacteriocin/lantibiotic exporter with double-glycine peptidase domain
LKTGKDFKILLLINQNYLFSSQNLFMKPLNVFYNYIFTRINGKVKHWVYLEDFDNDFAVIIDPAIGRLKFNFSDFIQTWNNKAILIKA